MFVMQLQNPAGKVVIEEGQIISKAEAVVLDEGAISQMLLRLLSQVPLL